MVWRLWGFGRAAWVGNPLAGVIGSGSTTAVASLALRRRSTGRFWPDRGHSTGLRRRRGDGDAAPEARFPDGRAVRHGDGRHGIAVLTPALGDGGARGSPPRSKVSTMIMRPPQP